MKKYEIVFNGLWFSNCNTSTLLLIEHTVKTLILVNIIGMQLNYGIEPPWSSLSRYIFISRVLLSDLVLDSSQTSSRQVETGFKSA